MWKLKVMGQGLRSVRSSGDRALPPGFILVLAVAAMSWGGPLVRFATAPALAVAAWRLILSVAAIGLVLTVRGRWGDVTRLSGREWLLALAAGALDHLPLLHERGQLRDAGQHPADFRGAAFGAASR